MREDETDPPDHRSLLRSLARRALAERTFVRPSDAPAPLGEDAQLLEMDLHRAGRQELGISDEAAPSHRAALWRVLNCWCAARPHIGYVQGINCIAAALLVMCEHSEDEAAVLLQLLVERLPADWYLDQLKGGRVESGALLLP